MTTDEIAMKGICDVMSDEELETMLVVVKREVANRSQAKCTAAAEKILKAIKEFEDMGCYFEIDFGDGEIFSLDSKNFKIRAADRTLVCVKY